MALSLVCQDCKAQLRSVQEMQQHSDATGHINFAESTEAVLNLQCEECGKPCRSETEKEIHIKRTGHQSFVDKTQEATVMDTETEMVEAAQELKEAGNTENGKPKDPEEMIPAVVDLGLRQQLEDMGFSANKATRALHYTSSSSLEAALTWIEEHEDDMEVEESLLVPKVPAKPKLTPEEARLQAEELIKKTRLRKEKEERELERLREQERIRSGKELLAAKRLEDDLKIKRNLEFRKREKEEEARAKEKIRLKLAEDRRERRRKLGLPEELSPQEEAAERAKQAEKEAAKAKRPPVPLKPLAAIDKMRNALVQMKKESGDDVAKSTTAFKTLLKYVGNIAQNPAEPKFRSIKLDNAAFQSRVACLPASLSFLEGVGFEKQDNVLTLAENAVSLDKLNAAGECLNNALTNPMFGVL